jgi:hypothetical protein
MNNCSVVSDTYGEYVEYYNTTADVINMKDWYLKKSTSSSTRYLVRDDVFVDVRDLTLFWVRAPIQP